MKMLGGMVGKEVEIKITIASHTYSCVESDSFLHVFLIQFEFCLKSLKLYVECCVWPMLMLDAPTASHRILKPETQLQHSQSYILFPMILMLFIRCLRRLKDVLFFLFFFAYLFVKHHYMHVSVTNREYAV